MELAAPSGQFIALQTFNALNFGHFRHAYHFDEIKTECIYCFVLIQVF